MIRIITDSTSDLSPELAEQLNVEIVRLTVHFGEESYRDGLDLSIDEFYQKLRAADTLPTTAQINPDQFVSLFSQHRANGDEIVGLFLSSELSGTCQSAVIAREELGGENIHVVDTRNVTLGLGLLVLEAARLRDEGASAQEIVAHVESLIPRVRLLAFVPTLRYLKMGGRLSGTTAALGSLLGVCPILDIQGGVLTLCDKARGRKRAAEVVLNRAITLDPDPAYPLVLGHTNTPDSFFDFQAQARARLGLPRTYAFNIGCTVGVHAGPDAMGLAFIQK